MSLSITSVQSGERDVQITLSNGVTLSYCYSDMFTGTDQARTFDAHHVNLHAAAEGRLRSTVNVDVFSNGKVGIYGTMNRDQTDEQWYDVPDVSETNREEINNLKSLLDEQERITKMWQDRESLAAEELASCKRTIRAFLDLGREASETHIELTG